MCCVGTRGKPRERERLRVGRRVPPVRRNSKREHPPSPTLGLKPLSTTITPLGGLLLVLLLQTYSSSFPPPLILPNTTTTTDSDGEYKKIRTLANPSSFERYLFSSPPVASLTAYNNYHPPHPTHLPNPPWSSVSFSSSSSDQVLLPSSPSRFSKSLVRTLETVSSRRIHYL